MCSKRAMRFGGEERLWPVLTGAWQYRRRRSMQGMAGLVAWMAFQHSASLHAGTLPAPPPSLLAAPPSPTPAPTRVVLLIPGHGKALLPLDGVPLQRRLRKRVAPPPWRPQRRHLLRMLLLCPPACAAHRAAAAAAGPGAAAAGVQLGGALWPQRWRRPPRRQLPSPQGALLLVCDPQRGAAPGKERVGCDHNAGAGLDSWRVGGGPRQVKVAPLLQQAAGALVGGAPAANLRDGTGRQEGQ